MNMVKILDGHLAAAAVTAQELAAQLADRNLADRALPKDGSWTAHAMASRDKPSGRNLPS